MIDEQERQGSGVKRKFNALVENEMVEDYSLRYAPRSFRKWSEYACATAALGGIAYLVDFAIGGSLMVTFGFSSAIWAILLAAATIFLTGLPIAYYSAKYNIDMDLLTRGAGFGYLGSTITSLIYASFTFIFFSLEAVVMAQALTLFTGIPIWVSYIISALMVIPLVVFGMTLLSKFQMWTQPIWFALIALPFIAILVQDPGAYSEWTSFGGDSETGPAFNLLSFGLAAGIALSLIAQIGEQVDYLRFMPEKTAANSKRWWAGVLSAGPGWVILGATKQIGGGLRSSARSLISARTHFSNIFRTILFLTPGLTSGKCPSSGLTRTRRSFAGRLSRPAVSSVVNASNTRVFRAGRVSLGRECRK